MNEYVLSVNGRDYRAEIMELTSDTALIRVNDREIRVELRQLGRNFSKTMPVKTVESPRSEPTRPVAAPVKISSGEGEASSMVKAPLPGMVTAVKAEEGQTVQAGQTILIMEAMKMENQIQATCDGRVKKIYVQKGDSVTEGAALAEIERSAIASL